MDIIHEPLIQKRHITLNFPDLVESLDLALQYPSKAAEYLKDFESKTFEIYLYAEQSIEWLEKQATLGLLAESAMSSFRMSSVMILDRYTELNHHMIKGLAQLCVLGGEIGKCAMSIVSETSNASEEGETCEILLQVVTPLLELFDGLPIDLKKNLLASLSKLPAVKRLAHSLHPTIQYVISDIIKDPWKSELCDLFVLLTLDEDNAADIEHYPVSKFLIRELEQYEIKSGMIRNKLEKVDTLIGFLKVIASSLKSCDKKVVSDFCNQVLFPNMRSLIGERVPTTRLSEPESRLGYHIIRLSTSICQSSEELLDELCNGFHLFDLLLVPIKESLANLQILAAALEGMCYILLHGLTSTKYALILIEELDPNIMLTYLEEQKRDKLIEKHSNEIINNLYLWYYRFISTLLYLSKTNYNMMELVEKMLNKGLNLHIVNNFGFSACDLKIRCELMNVVSLFPEDWIDSSIVTRLLNLLSSIDITNYHEKELESIVIILSKRLDLSPMDKLINNVTNLLVATLSIPNVRKYETLQVKIAKLLLDACELESARMHIRTENIMALLLKGLKYEQDYAHPECPDINVELSWTGNNAKFVHMCMLNTYHLKYDRKQFYRVLRSLERCLNGFDVFNNEKLLTFEQLCMKETDDFYDAASGVYEFNFLSNSDLSLHKKLNLQNYRQVQQHQQTSLFINMDLADRILSYLSPLFSLSFIQYYQHEKLRNQNSEYWAGILKGNKLDCERMNIVPKADEYSSLYNRLSSRDHEPSDEGREQTRIHKSAIDLVTHIISNKLNTSNYELQDCHFFKLLPKPLLSRAYLNEYTKQVNPSFTISSYLRILYGLIDTVENEVVKNKFKDPAFVRNLIKLVTSCNIFDCNLTAKLFKLFTKALTYNISLKAESMDMIVIYDIISRFIELIMKYVVAECILNVHKSWLDDENKHVQYLVLQLLKFISLVSRQVPLIKFSDIFEIQEYFAEKCLARFISEESIRIIMKIFVQLVTFQNTTSTGTYVVHLYDTSIIEAIMDNILLIIIQLIANCTNTNSYYIVSIISQFRRHDRISLKSSLLNSLLRQIYLYKVKSKFQLLISRVNIERIIILDESCMITNCLDSGKSEHNMHLVCVSSKNLHLLDYLEDKDEFETLKSFALSKLLLYSIDQGTMYLLHKEPAWVVFSLSYINYDLMKHLCHDNLNLLAEQLSHHTEDKGGDGEDQEDELRGVLVSVATYEDQFSLVAVTDEAVRIYEVVPELLVQSLKPKSERFNKLLLKTFIKPDARGEMKREVSHIKFLKPRRDVRLRNIEKIKFDYHFGVVLYEYESAEGNSEPTELDLVNHHSRERFKKFLAKNISTKSWRRSWSRHSDPD